MRRTASVLNLKTKTEWSKRPFIVFGKPDLGEEEMSAVMDVIRSGWIGTGKVTKQFETEFSNYMGGGYSVAVSSATIGLTLALKACGLHGDPVLTTPLTFCATVNAIIQAQCTPIFVDVLDDGNLDAWKVSKASSRAKAIVPVHYTGNYCRIWPTNGIPVIEDAAHSFGGGYIPQGIGVYSFYATKNITAGEGGMVWTKHKELADSVRMLSNHGQSNGAWSRYNSGPIENYEVIHPGLKGNMPDILAAIGITQLRRWPELEEKRLRIWRIYEQAFGEKPKTHSMHLYTILVKNRAKVRERLYEMGIGTGVHYEALHLQPAYKFLGYKKGDFPNAEKISAQTLSLPVSSTMTEDDAEYVVKSVKKVING